MKVEKTITIYKKDICYDIDAITHAYGKVHHADASFKQVDGMSTDVGELNDLGIMTRCADARYSALKDVMAFVIKEEDCDATDDVLALDASGSYTFAIEINSRFEDKNLEPIARLIHEYMVKGTLKDWYEAIGVQRPGLYDDRLPAIEKTIKSLLIHRPIPTISK